MADDKMEGRLENFIIPLIAPPGPFKRAAGRLITLLKGGATDSHHRRAAYSRRLQNKSQHLRQERSQAAPYNLVLLLPQPEPPSFLSRVKAFFRPGRY
jgi:hypothetical protein